MADYYQTHYRAFHERTFGVDPALFLTPFYRLLPPGATVLDVGCASGRDLIWLQNRGCRVTGLERSPGLAALARQNADCRVIEADLTAYDFSGFAFDGILAAGSLVHIPPHRLFSVMAHMQPALAPAGLFYVSLKQGRGTRTDETGRTFYLWDPATLEAIFNHLGLKILHQTRSRSALNSGDTWLGYVLTAS